MGKINAVDGVTEPQEESRLHGHLRVYSTNVTPTLLARIIPNQELREDAIDWIDDVNTTNLME